MTPRKLLVGALLLATFAACEKEEENDWVPIDFSGRKSTASPATSSPTAGQRPTSGTKPTPPTEPTRTTAAPPPPPAPPPPTASAGSDSALERGDRDQLRQRAKGVHAALVAALSPADNALVAKIPLGFDERKNEVNAFAACLRGKPILAISDGLMLVQSQLARAQATDEVFGTKKLDAYLQQLSKSKNLRPPKNFLTKEQEENPDKRRRQGQLHDEGIAFIVGHELAHHLLGHTGCVGGDPEHLTPADIARILRRDIPGFNQPNELASDVYGIQNVLTAGARGPNWTENGALLTLRFFKARSGMSLEGSLLFAFELTHPHPDLRIPVVQQTAEAWRATGGVSLPRIPL